jgi:hypothetical protein
VSHQHPVYSDYLKTWIITNLPLDILYNTADLLHSEKRSEWVLLRSWEARHLWHTSVILVSWKAKVWDRED